MFYLQMQYILIMGSLKIQIKTEEIKSPVIYEVSPLSHRQMGSYCM